MYLLGSDMYMKGIHCMCSKLTAQKWQNRTVFSTLIAGLIIKASESGTLGGFWRRNAE